MARFLHTVSLIAKGKIKADRNGHSATGTCTKSASYDYSKFSWLATAIASCRVGNSLICSSLICSFAHLLTINHFNEPLRAIRLDRSGQMSACERITLVAHDKRATMSNSLRLLMIKELMRESLVFLSKSLIRSFPHRKRSLIRSLPHRKRAVC